MKVGWLTDRPFNTGGAELTQEEFRALAPSGVEVVECPPGWVTDDLDLYVVHNCVGYRWEDVRSILDRPVVKYVNDLWPAGSPKLRTWLLSKRVIFTSPLHQRRFTHPVTGEATVVPPAVPLHTFRAVAGGNHREGAVCVGRMSYGKGLELLHDYREPVDVYSTVPVRSQGQVTYRGEASDVAGVLSHYSRFVFLPTATEPFGRAVVEAWAAGLSLVVNRNVGALHYLERDPDALHTAGVDFWEEVLR